MISIHALREESDAQTPTARTTSTYFNPRPPRGERPDLGGDVDNAKKFQSTPSARRATHQNECACGLPEFQSTPSARRATANQRRVKFDIRNFNPRPPRGERLLDALALFLPIVISIHALREESDGAFLHFPGGGSISIHALREESDFGLPPTVLLALYFNPRPPRGERPKPPVRSHKLVTISIHALREESDGCWG